MVTPVTISWHDTTLGSDGASVPTVKTEAIWLDGGVQEVDVALQLASASAITSVINTPVILEFRIATLLIRPVARID
jgi:hypothetical protein